MYPEHLIPVSQRPVPSLISKIRRKRGSGRVCEVFGIVSRTSDTREPAVGFLPHIEDQWEGRVREGFQPVDNHMKLRVRKNQKTSQNPLKALIQQFSSYQLGCFSPFGSWKPVWEGLRANRCLWLAYRSGSNRVLHMHTLLPSGRSGRSRRRGEETFPLHLWDRIEERRNVCFFPPVVCSQLCCGSTLLEDGAATKKAAAAAFRLSGLPPLSAFYL